MTTQRTTSGDVEDAAGASNQDPQALRSAMVEGIIARQEQLGRAVPLGVEAALHTVPRHLFTPEAQLEEAYTDDALVTKKNERGVHISSVSAPNVIAGMLGQLDTEQNPEWLGYFDASEVHDEFAHFFHDLKRAKASREHALASRSEARREFRRSRTFAGLILAGSFLDRHLK